jgi:hypothetical protein
MKVGPKSANLYIVHGGLKTSWVAHVCCLKVDGLCGSPLSRSYIGETERSYRDLSTSVPSRPHIYANIQAAACKRVCWLTEGSAYIKAKWSARERLDGQLSFCVLALSIEQTQIILLSNYPIYMNNVITQTHGHSPNVFRDGGYLCAGA